MGFGRPVFVGSCRKLHRVVFRDLKEFCATQKHTHTHTKVRVVDSNHNHLKYTPGSVKEKVPPGPFGFLTWGTYLSTGVTFDASTQNRCGGLETRGRPERKGPRGNPYAPLTPQGGRQGGEGTQCRCGIKGFGPCRLNTLLSSLEVDTKTR